MKWLQLIWKSFLWSLICFVVFLFLSTFLVDNALTLIPLLIIISSLLGVGFGIARFQSKQKKRQKHTHFSYKKEL